GARDRYDGPPRSERRPLTSRRMPASARPRRPRSSDLLRLRQREDGVVEGRALPRRDVVAHSHGRRSAVGQSGAIRPNRSVRIVQRSARTPRARRMRLIDLRSDTVTRPSQVMRRVMADAEVGDDVFSEDPSVRELEAVTAELLGKQRALFVPSGTMANQLALLTQTRPGDQVVVGHGAHIAWHEAGAGAAWAGVQFSVAGTNGLFTAQELETVIEPMNPHGPRVSLVCLENTHNLSGGKVLPM